MKKILSFLVLIPFLALVECAGEPSAKTQETAKLILLELRILDSAIGQYSIETNKGANTPVTWEVIQTYLKRGTRIYDSGGKDPLGNAYSGGKFVVGRQPTLSPQTAKEFSSVVSDNYWSPYH